MTSDSRASFHKEGLRPVFWVRRMCVACDYFPRSTAARKYARDCAENDPWQALKNGSELDGQPAFQDGPLGPRIPIMHPIKGSFKGL